MSATSRAIFVNLAISDLDRSVEFFTALGFEFSLQFTDETATCLIINDQAYVMLVTEGRFKDFTRKAIADAQSSTEAIMALSATSRDEVDELVDKALAHGGKPANDPMDLGFMYVRSFEDPDGHLWEILYMDPTHIED